MSMDSIMVMRVLLVGAILSLLACQPSVQTEMTEKPASQTLPVTNEQSDSSSTQSVNSTELALSENTSEQAATEVDAQTGHLVDEASFSDQTSQHTTGSIDKFAMSEQLEQMRQNLDDSFNKATPRKSFDDCAKRANGVTPDILECINIEFSYQDKRLNDSYKKLTINLSEEKKAMLVSAQRQWLKATDDGCIWVPDVDGQAGQMYADTCRLNRTINRIAELEKMSAN